MSSLRYVAVFLAGLLAGVIVCGIYIASLKATIKLLELYIHERIDKAWHPQEKPVPAPKTASRR